MVEIMYNYPKAKTVSQGVEVAVQILETFTRQKSQACQPLVGNYLFLLLYSYVKVLSREKCLASTFVYQSQLFLIVNYISDCLISSVPNPDPWIRTLDLRIRILLFPSVTSKMPTKNNFLF
jgi:hypothetical protein